MAGEVVEGRSVDDHWQSKFQERCHGIGAFRRANPSSTRIRDRPPKRKSARRVRSLAGVRARLIPERSRSTRAPSDRKSTRLNSSHSSISYAVFCLKKKKTTKSHIYQSKKKK